MVTTTTEVRPEIPMTPSRPTTPAQSALFRERYGAPRPWSRPVTIGLVLLLAVAGLAWLLWAAAAQSSSPVSAQLQGYEVESEHLVSVTVTVARRHGDPVRCEVYAQAADRSIVGEQTFEIPAGNPGIVTVEHDIPTEREAVEGVLRGCTVSGAAS
jgi:hypothetical protein